MDKKNCTCYPDTHTHRHTPVSVSLICVLRTHQATSSALFPAGGYGFIGHHVQRCWVTSWWANVMPCHCIIWPITLHFLKSSFTHLVKGARQIFLKLHLSAEVSARVGGGFITTDTSAPAVSSGFTSTGLIVLQYLCRQLTVGCNDNYYNLLIFRWPSKNVLYNFPECSLAYSVGFMMCPKSKCVQFTIGTLL